MNRKMISRTALTVTILVFFIVIGFYFYYLLSQKEKEAEMNLFTLIPQTSIAIVETQNINYLFHNMDKLDYGQPYDSLNVSDLLDKLKNSFKVLSESKVHGLSSQMSRVFISFHQPNTVKDQILYCKLGLEDKAFIEEFIHQNTSKDFPPKTFKYKGEKIHIYSIGNDFLACYYKADFLVISYQEKLIEEVIDTYQNNSSVLSDSVFAGIIRNQKVHADLTLYVKSSRIPHGEVTESNPRTCARIAHWTEFDIKMNPDAIYLSGTNYDTDSCHSFNNALKGQQPTKTFPIEQLPVSTYYLCQLSISDFPRMQEQVTTGKQQTKADSCLTDYLRMNNDGTICNFYFYDAQNNHRNLTSISLKDQSKAETDLKGLIFNYAKETPGNKHLWPRYFYTTTKGYPIYTLPEISFFTQLARKETAKETGNQYACFYDNRLLVASNDSCIYAYIRQMNEKEAKGNNNIYEKCMAGLANESICLLMADMGQILPKANLYNDLLPSFFFKHKNFFKDFVMTIQFTSAQGLIYPNIILTYKSKNDNTLFSKR